MIVHGDTQELTRKIMLHNRNLLKKITWKSVEREMTELKPNFNFSDVFIAKSAFDCIWSFLCIDSQVKDEFDSPNFLA